MKDKLVAITILRVYSFLTVLVSSLLLLLFYKIDTTTAPKVIMLIAIIGFSFALICAFTKKYTITKFVVSVLPVYVLIFGSSITKSLGLFDTIIFFISPLLISIILLFPPILFFGIHYLKTVLFILFIELIPILLYNQIHLYFGVDYRDMIFDPTFFPHFVGIIAFFFLVFFFAVFLLQKVQFLNIKRLKTSNNELGKERITIKNLNKSLQYQANLYGVLAVVSKKEDIESSLKKVLDELFSIDLLGIHKKGIILKKNREGTLELIAHKNIPILQNTPNISQVNMILLGKELISKEFLSNEISLYQEIDYTTIPEGATKDGHYLVHVKDHDEVIGIINLCVDTDYKIDKDVREYLIAVGDIIAYRIILENYYAELTDKNEELNAKKLVLESTLSELNDSINYSYQLQKSLIPNQKTLHSFFEQSYCLYLPKDKVSGDFYFIKERKESTVFGIGDCTGHGIPGSIIAAMSIETVNQTLDDNPTAPVHEILELLRLKSKERFNINIDEKRNDSMDSGICEYNKKDKVLYFSGGNINCVLVRDNKVSMYRGDRIPVGIYPVEKPFKLVTIPILKGDVVYLFSDGITDQFGCEKHHNKSRKLQRKNFYAWVMDLQNHPFEDHYGLLLEKLHFWKKTVEQTDDITIFSVKF